MTGMGISTIILSLLVQRSVPTVSDVRETVDDLARNQTVEQNFGPLAAEYHEALSEQIKDRAQDLDNLQLQSLAFHWDLVTEHIDMSIRFRLTADSRLTNRFKPGLRKDEYVCSQAFLIGDRGTVD